MTLQCHYTFIIFISSNQTEYQRNCQPIQKNEKCNPKSVFKTRIGHRPGGDTRSMDYWSDQWVMVGPHKLNYIKIITLCVLLTCILRTHVQESKRRNFALKNQNLNFQKIECMGFRINSSILSSLTCILMALVSIGLTLLCYMFGLTLLCHIFIMFCYIPLSQIFVNQNIQLHSVFF